MPTVTQFNTKSVRLWYKPQPDTFSEIEFPHSFVAPPRLPHGFCNLNIDRNTNIRARSVIKNIRIDSAVYHLTSWADTTLYAGITNSLNLAPANLEILTGEYTHTTSDPNSKKDVRINFGRPFVTPPKVVVFFNHIDLDKSKSWFLKTTATDIDAEGFTLSIDTWADTILYAATACWIAYPEDRKHTFSASVNTMDVRPWSQPQLLNSESISFGNVKFLEKPSVFLAFNQFDVGCQANFRLHACVDNVTTSGLTWHINSWDDTVLYSAGITIIAVN
ncbi:hypothetical protein AX16_010073 [Volvariella volvacea WC 439]|nr:hypothetical protein AX16_010073 [Volvariella volvacea WC 439]